jgi:hypothetical protein
MSPFDGEAGMYLIREALEGVIEPSTASGIVFEALEAAGANDLPDGLPALLAFVRGPLATVLGKRVGGAIADEVTERIEQTFERIDAGYPTSRSDMGSTLELPIGGGPVKVLVVSRSSGLAVRLRAVLGGFTTQIANAATPSAAREKAAGLVPDLVIVDAAEPIDEIDALLDVLVDLGGTTTRVLWGEEQPAGARLKRAAANRKTPLTTVDRREGVETLLDLIRSRQG